MKVQEVAPRVTRINLLPLDSLNVYVIDDILVDAGGRLHANRLLKVLADRTLSAVALTHAHFDHQGSAHEVCEHLQVPLWCGAGDRAAVETGNQSSLLKNPDGFFGRFATWMAGPAHEVSRTLSEGDVVGSFQVLETSGHTPGHLAYWREADGILILGDVLFHRNPLSLLAGLQEPFRFATTDLGANRRAARRLAALDPAVTCFGHGEPLKGSTRLREFVATLPE
jgi:hydroxyacylglutathione hydrolase